MFYLCENDFSMNTIIKINFADFWTHFDKQNNYFTNLLSKYFKVEIAADPDFLIYSCYGNEHLKYSCYRIFYNGENQRINWNACDFAFSFDHISDERYYRLPNWIWYNDPGLLLNPKPGIDIMLSNKTGFCNMVVSNPHSSKRIDFFHKLSTYKKIDSGGRYLNNIGSPVDDKLAFISRYKFTLSFENSSYPGYTTEKIFEPMIAGSIPIYWGNPDVGRDFNTASFVNWHDFKDDQQLIVFIIKLDNNDDLYARMWQATWYRGNQLPECVKEENVIAQFEKIFSIKGKKKPVAQSFKKYWYELYRFRQRIDSSLNLRLKYRKGFR